MKEALSKRHNRLASARSVWAGVTSFWRWLTEPAATIQEPYRRQQARLLATLLIACMALATAMEAVTVALMPASAHYMGYQQTLLAMAFILVAYALSRTEHFERGAILSVAVATLAVFASLIAEGNATYIEFLDFLIVPLLLGSLFLSARVVFWFTVLDVAGILLVPQAIPSVFYDQVLVGPAMFIVTSGGLFLLAMRQRAALERHRRAELAESEARLANIINLAGDAIVAVDEQQGIVLFNREAESVFGYAAGEVLGRLLDVLLPIRFITAHRDHLRTVAALPDSTQVMHQHRHVTGRRKDGSEFLAESSLSRMSVGGQQVFLVILRDITERVHAEEALRRSEERYRAFVEQSAESIWCFELEKPVSVDLPADEQIRLMYQYGYLSECNDVMARMYGFASARDLIGARLGHLLPESDSRSIKYLQSVIRSGYRLSGAEWHQRDRDGNLKHFLNSLACTVENGQLVRIWGTQRDITERTKAEEEIRRLNQDLERRVAERTSQLAATNSDLAREIAERQQAQAHLLLLERAVESSANGIVISNPLEADNPVIYVNAAFEHMTGYSREGVLGRNCRFLQGNDRDQSGLVELRAAVREGRECRVVLRNYRRDGSLFWNELHLSPVRDDAGRVTHFVGIQTDITELKLIEEAVRASEARFRQLAENIHEVFFIVAAGSREMLYVSPAYEDIWGRTCDSLYRDPQSFFDTIHPDDRERVARAMNLQTEEPGFSECRIVRPDGTLGWVWVRTFPVRSAGGAVYRIVGVAEDVTERKQAEEELHKALEQERELNELKSRFVSMMSHEFRTPLSAILSSSEMLEHYHHKLTEVRQAEHFNRIRLSVKNMTQMLEDILILGKAEAGKMEFHPEPLDLAAFCRDLAEEMQLSAGNQHTIEFVADGDGAEARLDPRLLRQILANLLSNAMKYSPNGDAVHFEMRREDGHIVFSVRDQGIGIPPEEHARMFETFHRAKNVGNIPGTGLGLAIVKRSVDLCGGTIAFDSSVGSGTTFTIALPLDDLHPHEVYA